MGFGLIFNEKGLGTYATDRCIGNYREDYWLWMKVHSLLGNGFQEVIYQRALEIEMQDSGIDFNREFEMPIYYKEQMIGTRRVDFLVKPSVSVELKAIIQLERIHFAQAMNYLEAYNLQTGLLINFGSSSLQFHRLTNKKYVSHRIP